GAAGPSNVHQGAAYVFVKPASGWTTATETAKLTASNGTTGSFGYSVAISGDTVAVSETGAEYVFVKPAAGWTNMTQTAKLTASDGGLGGFGYSISVSGDTVVAGSAAG